MDEPIETVGDALRIAASLPADVRLVVAARIRVIAAFETIAEDIAHGQRGSFQKAFAAAFNARKIALDASVYQTIDTLSPQKLKRWRRAVRDGGSAALAPRYGCRMNDGVIGRDPDLSDYLTAQITARPHISPAMLMSGLRARFADRAGDLPGYRTVQRWVARWRFENKRDLLAIADPDAWRSKYQSAGGSRSEGITRPNQLWELDSTVGEVLLIDPGTAKPKRYNLIQVIDVATRRTRLLVARSSTAAGIAALMRRAMIDWGVPETIKTDNGQDYISNAIRTIVASLDIEQRFCPPFTPEAKPHVERCFKTFLHQIVELLPGYCGHNVAQRKALENRRAFSRRLGNAEGLIEAELTPDEFQIICDKWATDIYGHRVHASLGRSPFAEAAAWRGPIRRIADERALDILLLPAAGKDAVRVITKKGVAIAGGVYIAGALGAMVADQVRVLTDPADLGHVYIFDLDGRFVCEAENPRRRGVSAAEVAAAMKATQARAIAEKKAELRAAMRQVKTDDLADEILSHAGKSAARVIAFPAREVETTTPALLEAGRAARAGDFEVRDETAAEASRREALAARLAARDQARAPVDDAATRFARALAIEAALGAGRPVAEPDRRFFEFYSQSVEWRARKRIAERLGHQTTG